MIAESSDSLSQSVGQGEVFDGFGSHEKKDRGFFSELNSAVFMRNPESAVFVVRLVRHSTPPDEMGFDKRERRRESLHDAVKLCHRVGKISEKDRFRRSQWNRKVDDDLGNGRGTVLLELVGLGECFVPFFFCCL
jgi:hypothetical protein